MLKNILYKTVLCLGMSLALTACSQDEVAGGESPQTGSSVRILCRIANASNTRADTEPGWDDGWNENTIQRLDIFRFDKDGNAKGRYVPTAWPTFTNETTGYQEVTVNGLTYRDLSENQTDQFYMVANCSGLEDIEVENIAALKASMATPTLVFNEKQTVFAMDGKGTLDVNTGSQEAMLSFDLSRAAAKIRLLVNNSDKNNITSQCTYQLFNYVLSSTSVLSDGEMYGKGNGQTLQDMTDLGKSALEKDDKAIFYSYPNDWFDESFLDKNTGTFPLDKENKPTNPYAYDNLIDENRQTYFLLKAPYGGNTYYYKVPVNFSIADYNDKESFTKEEIETLRSDYYRLSRNHLYDITVTIDREGGSLTEPVTPKFHILVEDWKEGGSYEISDGEFQEDPEKSGD